MILDCLFFTVNLMILYVHYFVIFKIALSYFIVPRSRVLVLHFNSQISYNHFILVLIYHPTN